MGDVPATRDRPESINPGKRGRGGRRADLGDRYFRSRYEANYARYLNWAKIPWEYENKTFWFEGIQKGNRSYTPDFWLPSKNVYNEVKGWMDPASKTKLDRMKRYFPEIKVIVIGADWFREAERQHLCSMIPGWECQHTER